MKSPLIAALMFSVVGFVAAAQAEDVTITTTYAAPRGLYKRLRLQSAPADATSPDATSLELVNQGAAGAGGRAYTWRLWTAADTGAPGLVANAFELWEYPSRFSNPNAPRPGEAAAGCCRARLIVLPSPETNAASASAHDPPPLLLTGTGGLGLGLPQTSTFSDVLRVRGSDDATSRVVFLPGADTGAPGTPALRVGLGTSSPQAALHLQEGALLASGTSGPTPLTGPGTRFMWIPAKAALRAGSVDGSQWDEANIGSGSLAVGPNAQATTPNSLALGPGAQATAANAVAIGAAASASATDALALGANATAAGAQAIALSGATATGPNALAIGLSARASAQAAIALGARTSAQAAYAMVLGHGAGPGPGLANTTPDSLAIGFNSDTPTLVVGPSAGPGTTGNVGIGTADPENTLTPVPNSQKGNLNVNDAFLRSASGGQGVWASTLGPGGGTGSNQVLECLSSATIPVGSSGDRMCQRLDVSNPPGPWSCTAVTGNRTCDWRPSRRGSNRSRCCRIVIR